MRAARTRRTDNRLSELQAYNLVLYEKTDPKFALFVTFRRTYRARSRYVLRMMGSLIVVLLLMIGLVRLWPTGDDAPDLVYSDAGNETIHIEEIQPTSQSPERRPPPPAPLPPIVVPNEVVVDVEPIEFTDASLPIDEPGEDAVRQDGADRAAAARPPDVNARLLRYVEPEYTRAARRRDVRAQVVIEVQVDERGRVQSAAVLERILLSEDGQPTRTVDRLGYGLEEAALTAARACLFRPARADGQPVPTRTTLTIRFGD